MPSSVRRLLAALVTTVVAAAGMPAAAGALGDLVAGEPTVTARLTAATAAAGPHDPCAGVLACGADLDAALELEQRVDDHLVWDQLVEIDYRTPERVPGDVANVGAWGDSGLWTGTYLAAQSFRYATAKHHLTTRPLTGPQRKFWIVQRDEALGRVRRMVRKYHLLVNIARGWRTELAPSTNPPSFGGGVVQGEAGMLMRACAPVDAPPNQDMPRNRRVFGPFPWEDGRSYLCETAPSRDTYAGTTFGLLTAFDLVASDDPAMAARIRDDVLILAGFLVKHGWNFPRPHGNVSLPPLGHDFDNFASPLFVTVPLARLNMAQAARHVATTLGTEQQRLQWNAVWAEELATQGPLLAASMEFDAVQPNEAYYKYNLHHLTGFNLVRLERDPAVREEFRRALAVMDRTTGDDVNAHFEAITHSLTGERARLDAAVLHLRQWRDYRARIAAGGLTDNASRCGTTVECVPRDQYDVELDAPPAGEEIVTVPGTSTQLRARFPLPVADRPPTDFLWQRTPTQLNGSTSATHQAPGADYLVPYWMLRYHTEVRSPQLEPFPPYPGPEHR